MKKASIPYGRQSISEADIQAVVNVLHSDWLTQGPSIEQFEHVVAAYCGAKYAVSFNSATSALHISCLAADLGPGMQCWTSPNTFVASANCALYCGATVDFVDIDCQTYNICKMELKEKLNRAEQTGHIPKVVVPVHFAGQSCDMEQLLCLSQKYGFAVIEDASHAIGGRYNNTRIGCCAYSDMTVFSFHPVKIITTGEGGMVLTNREDLYEKLLLLRSHGITRNKNLMQDGSHGAWYYEQVELGFNYRMTDIQAALGKSQMSRLDTFVARRHFLAERYNVALRNLPLILPFQHFHSYSSFHLYVICIDESLTRLTRRYVFDALRERNINVNVHYIPVHTQPYYQARGFSKGDFPVAEAYYNTAISIPLYFDLGEEEQDYIVESLKDILQ